MNERRHDPRQRYRPARGRLQERALRPRTWRPVIRVAMDDAIVYQLADVAPASGAAGWRETLRHMNMGTVRQAKFQIGDVVRHRFFPFRGVIFDVDPVFANTEEWWQSIPEEIRPRKDQPFYHLLAENDDSTYVAYVSEQNLLPDESGKPSKHPDIGELFVGQRDGRYVPRTKASN
jgi:heat shock protein HspQ